MTLWKEIIGGEGGEGWTCKLHGISVIPILNDETGFDSRMLLHVHYRL